MQSQSRGFTLIEILVVMVIVAIIAGVAVLSLGSLGRAPPAKHAAEQLSALSELASEQAVMEGRQYGLLISRHGYQFFIYDGVRWLPITDDQTFRARVLGDDVILDLHLEGAPVKLATTKLVPAASSTSMPDGADANDHGDTLQPKPQIALLSSGEITPFEIAVSDTVNPSVQYLVSGSLANGIKLHQPDDSHADTRP